MLDADLPLIREIPLIRRARGWRLYTETGRRLLDLWQYGGEAILGHTPPSVFREIKNTAARGLAAPFPSRLEARCLRALSRLFPGASFRLYRDEASLRHALAAAGVTGGPFPDPALGTAGGPAPALGAVGGPAPALGAVGGPGPALETVGGPGPALEAVGGPGPALGTVGGDAPALWRPFLGPGPGIAPQGRPPGAALLVPVLPITWPGAPRVLVIRAPGSDPGHLKLNSASLAPSDALSPVILAALSRVVYDLIAAPAPPVYSRLDRTLEGSAWKRRGVYLCLKPAPEDAAYAALFRRFLSGGFLLPPSSALPAILPGEMSPGEEAALAQLFRVSV